MMSCPDLPQGFWLDFTWEYKDNSDHWTFYEARIPSLYVHTGLHDDYHRPSDDSEKLNVEGIQQVSRYVLTQICELADADSLPGFRSRSSGESPHSQEYHQRRLAPLPPRLAVNWKFFDQPSPHVLVQRVPYRSAAYGSGLRRGDRIVAVDDLPIADEATFARALVRAGSEVAVTIDRPGAEAPETISVKLSGSPIRLGISWREDPADAGAVYVTRVVPHSPAYQSGIRLMDRLYAFEGNAVDGQDRLLRQVRDALDSDLDSLHFEVESRGQIRSVVVSLRSGDLGASDPSL